MCVFDLNLFDLNLSLSLSLSHPTDKHTQTVEYARTLSYPAVALTLLEPTLTVVKLMDDVADPAVAQALSVHLLHLFTPNGLSLSLLTQLIRKELHTCENPSTYFRSNTITSHLLTQYCKRLGHAYLLSCLRYGVVCMCCVLCMGVGE
jgi:GTPase-activator protein for Ras-like GTPase